MLKATKNAVAERSLSFFKKNISICFNFEARLSRSKMKLLECKFDNTEGEIMVKVPIGDITIARVEKF